MAVVYRIRDKSYVPFLFYSFDDTSNVHSKYVIMSRHYIYTFTKVIHFKQMYKDGERNKHN